MGGVNKSPFKSRFLTEMQLTADKILGIAQEQLRSKLRQDTYNMWFAPLQAAEMDAGSVTLAVANEFCEVWLKENYMELLQDALAVAAGRRLLIKFKVNGHLPAQPAPAPAPTRATKHSEPASERAASHGDLHFNPKNTFDTFVVGTNNNFACAAAKAVAEAPGKSYNPLFLYGGVGLGKTDRKSVV